MKQHLPLTVVNDPKWTSQRRQLRVTCCRPPDRAVGYQRYAVIKDFRVEIGNRKLDFPFGRESLDRRTLIQNAARAPELTKALREQRGKPLMGPPHLEPQ